MTDMILRVMLDVAETVGACGQIGTLNASKGLRAIFADFANASKLNKWLRYADSSFGGIHYTKDENFVILWIE